MIPTLSPDLRRPLVEHLEELRRRLLRSFLWVGAGAALTWKEAGNILAFLVQPVGQVVYLSPGEPLWVHMKTAFLGGMVIGSPLVAWEIWGFFKPALRRDTGWLLVLLGAASGGLFMAGAWFGWCALLPAGLQFLRQFGTGWMTPMLTVDHYLSFAGWIIVGCGFTFQHPLVILFLAKMGWVRPMVLLRQWRPAVVAILVAAAALTPTTDIFTQLLLAGPMLLLYAASVGLSFLVAG